MRTEKKKILTMYVTVLRIGKEPLIFKEEEFWIGKGDKIPDGEINEGQYERLAEELMQGELQRRGIM